MLSVEVSCPFGEYFLTDSILVVLHTMHARAHSFRRVESDIMQDSCQRNNIDIDFSVLREK